MDRSYLPPIEFLRECFSYDPDTGILTWKTRPPHHFGRDCDCETWNRQNAGRRAFVGRDAEGYGRSQVRYEGRRIRTKASRVAYKLMTGQEPEQIDHVNGDETDDRFENLRPARNIDNARNRIGKREKPLPKGVFYEKGRFCASINLDGNRRKRLGSFSSPSEAHAAYCAAARKVHGEFFNPGPDRPTIFD